MRDKLDKYLDTKQDIEVILNVVGPSTYDYACFGVDENEKLSDDRYMIFYNQVQSPKAAITYKAVNDCSSFVLSLSKLPQSINKLAFIISIDGNGSMKDIDSLKVEIFQNNRSIINIELGGDDFQNEKSVIALEIYRKDVWRFSVTARGYNGGLEDVLEHYGGMISERDNQCQEEKFSSIPEIESPKPIEISFDDIQINKPSNEIKEPSYLKTSVLIVLTVILSFIPHTCLLLIPLIYLKGEWFKAQLKESQKYGEDEYKNLKLAADKIVSNINFASNKIFNDAMIVAKQLTQKAQDNLQHLNSQIENKQQIISKIIQDATAQADIANVAAKRKLDSMQAEIDKKEFYLNEIEQIKRNITALENKAVSQQEKIDALMRIRKSVNTAINTYFSNYSQMEYTIDLPDELIREIDSLSPSILLNLRSMDYKDLRRAFRANEKLIAETLSRYETRYTTKTNRSIYQLMVIALRAELQNILYTLTYSKLNDGIQAVKDITNKYLNIARDGSQTIASTLAKFIGEIEPLFIDAVKIEYEYYVKREAARQEQMELRAKMREEAEEQKRLKEQQEQMEKEEYKYNAEIENIRDQINTSVDEEKNQLLLEKIKILEAQLKELAEKKEEIVNLQNGKAGYVYIISNLGSFGDNVFKIGMTRRLNPQERIDELGSASVPFKFDVHSFIFSEDAVQLESNLHSALDSKRLNKVNLRKEFFKISIEELEKMVEKFDPAAEFSRTMRAEQYYQSLSLLEEQQ